MTKRKDLSGYTPEQKRARHNEQKRESARRKAAEHAEQVAAFELKMQSTDDMVFTMRVKRINRELETLDMTEMTDWTAEQWAENKKLIGQLDKLMEERARSTKCGQVSSMVRQGCQTMEHIANGGKGVPEDDLSEDDLSEDDGDKKPAAAGILHRAVNTPRRSDGPGNEDIGSTYTHRDGYGNDLEENHSLSGVNENVDSSNSQASMPNFQIPAGIRRTSDPSMAPPGRGEGFSPRPSFGGEQGHASPHCPPSPSPRNYPPSPSPHYAARPPPNHSAYGYATAYTGVQPGRPTPYRRPTPVQPMYGAPPVHPWPHYATYQWNTESVVSGPPPDPRRRHPPPAASASQDDDSSFPAPINSVADMPSFDRHRRDNRWGTGASWAGSASQDDSSPPAPINSVADMPSFDRRRRAPHWGADAPWAGSASQDDSSPPAPINSVADMPSFDRRRRAPHWGADAAWSESASRSQFPPPHVYPAQGYMPHYPGAVYVEDDMSAITGVTFASSHRPQRRHHDGDHPWDEEE